jgi:hypothetical protein
MVSPEKVYCSCFIRTYANHNTKFQYFNLRQFFKIGFSVLYCSKAVLASLNAWDLFEYYKIQENN